MPRPDGFTLIEVLVALVVGSLVLLDAHAILSALTDQALAITARTADADRQANGERELRALAGRLEIGAAGTIPFTGDPDQVHFSSWCEVPSGWLERCAVTLAFDTLRAEPVLVARMEQQATMVLIRGFARGSFRYLESAATGGQWFLRWGTGITAPLGIGVILDYRTRTDTLILRIGPRG